MVSPMTSAESRLIELYEKYQRYVASYCARRTTSDRVDDAVSEVFLVAWRRIADVPEGAAALRWLYGVAYKVLGRQWRTASRGRGLHEKLESLGVDPVPIPEELIVVQEQSEQAFEALGRLRALDREILLLAAWEDLGYSEIAQVLDIRPDAVRQRFHKAKKRLTREFNRSERTSFGTPAAEKGGVW